MCKKEPFFIAVFCISGSSNWKDSKVHTENHLCAPKPRVTPTDLQEALQNVVIGIVVCAGGGAKARVYNMTIVLREKCFKLNLDNEHKT